MLSSDALLKLMQTEQLPEAHVLAKTLYQARDLALLRYFSTVYLEVRKLFLQDIQQFCASSDLDTLLKSPIIQDEILWETLHVHIALLRLVVAEVELAYGEDSDAS